MLQVWNNRSLFQVEPLTHHRESQVHYLFVTVHIFKNRTDVICLLSVVIISIFA